MTVKIYSAVKRFIKFSELIRLNRKRWQLILTAKLHYRTLPSHPKSHTDRPRSQFYGTNKLATFHITPKLRLLSFRAGRNHLYFSFARPHTDLIEFRELCEEVAA
ncbi:uncharacterized protein [Choristoneura fumiferana]|uniref:uncharacterized protein n=1 Tax=Choristoneura fumiferana TaxID=7141 RepID=UPI003D15A931